MTDDKTNLYKVAIGDGFSGDVIRIRAVDEDEARTKGQQYIDGTQNTHWSVLGVRTA